MINMAYGDILGNACRKILCHQSLNWGEPASSFPVLHHRLGHPSEICSQQVLLIFFKLTFYSVLWKIFLFFFFYLFVHFCLFFINVLSNLLFPRFFLFLFLSFFFSLFITFFFLLSFLLFLISTPCYYSLFQSILSNFIFIFF